MAKSKRQHQIPGDVHYAGPPRPPVGALAFTPTREDIAPTAATRSSIEAASKAIRKRSSSRPDRQADLQLITGSLGVDRGEGGADDGDRDLDEERRGEHRREPALAGIASPERFLDAAHVGGDEQVQDHHSPRVDDDLRGGDELRVQQQEQPGERDQVDDQGEDAVEGVAKRDHRDRPAEGADRPAKKQTSISGQPFGLLVLEASRIASAGSE